MKENPNKFLWWLFGLTAAIGLAEAFFPENGGAYGTLAFPHMLVGSILLFAWCKAHARASEINEPSGPALLCGLIGVVGVPLYFFRGFGFKKGCIGTLKALGVLILVAITYDVANEAGKYMAHNTSLHPSGFTAG